MTRGSQIDRGRDGKRGDGSSGGALLLVGGFAGTILYRGGFDLETLSLCAGLVCLQLWLLHSVTLALRRAQDVPIGAIGVTLLLWWTWLALSLAWHPVPHSGRVAFWVLGCLPLAFLAYAASPARDRLWRLGFGSLAALGLGLALYGCWQQAVERGLPRSLFLNPNSHAALLYLVTLPLLGWFVSGDGAAGRRRAALLTPVVATLVFSIAAVKSRGASVVLWMGIAVVFAVGVREGLVRLRPRRWAALAALCLAAFLAGDLVPAKGPRGESSLSRVADSVRGGLFANRRALWGAAYDMGRGAPWHGAGLGMFHFEYTPRRPYEDRSSGSHAHNDYLELGFEAGVPGLALFLLLGAATLAGFARLQLAPGVSGERRLEAACLFAGLLALAAHSLLTFNFYQPVLLLVFGLVLGRLQILVAASRGASVRMRPAPLAVVWIGSGITLALVAALGVSALSHQLARSQGPGAPAEAIEPHLVRANRFAPEFDTVLYSHAQLCRLQLDFGEPSLEERRALVAKGLDLVERAVRANPFRKQTPQLRADLLQRDPDRPDARKRAAWREALERTLELDPRWLPPRMRLARLLLGEGRPDEARSVLEAGSRYAHPFRDDDYLAYRALLAQQRLAVGDLEGATQAARDVDRMLEMRGREPGYLARLRGATAPE